MSNIVLLLSITIVLFSGCEKAGLCEDDELTLNEVDYEDNQLKIDGYYFGNVTKNSTPPLVDIYYLYRNGIFYTSDAADLAQAEAGTIYVNIKNEFGKKIKGAWGVFQVNGSTIEIERWQTEHNGCESIIYERGNILNDTTFVLNYREFRDNGKLDKAEAIYATFLFRPLPAKPDSSNPYIN